MDAGTIVLNVFLLLLGFVLLVKGADFFVDGASGIAKKLKVSTFIIGVTVVALGLKNLLQNKFPLHLCPLR